MGNILKRGKEEDPDSAWQEQNKEMERNPAYKFADLNKGGKLIEAYRKKGVVAVQEIARNEIQPYLYNGGKGGVITKLDYVKWTRKNQAKRTVRDTQSLYKMAHYSPALKKVGLYWICHVLLWLCDSLILWFRDCKIKMHFD